MIQTRDSVFCIFGVLVVRLIDLVGYTMQCPDALGLDRRIKCNKLLVFLNSGGGLIISHLKRTFRYATLGRGESSRPNG